MTSGNQRISMSGVFGPALLARTGTSLEDFELYGSLYERAPSYYIHQRDDRHLLIVVDTDKCGTRRSEIGEYRDRKSTRLNSSHQIISYAVFCLKKKKCNYSITRLEVVAYDQILHCCTACYYIYHCHLEYHFSMRYVLSTASYHICWRQWPYSSS